MRASDGRIAAMCIGMRATLIPMGIAVYIRTRLCGDHTIWKREERTNQLSHSDERA